MAAALFLGIGLLALYGIVRLVFWLFGIDLPKLGRINSMGDY
jgi:hypothetical protein